MHLHGKRLAELVFGARQLFVIVVGELVELLDAQLLYEALRVY